MRKRLPFTATVDIVSGVAVKASAEEWKLSLIESGRPALDTRTAEVVRAILAGVGVAKVAVLGDLCVDAYWDVDTSSAELSVETGLPVQRITGQRYELGGAGNVAGNLRAMGVGQVRAIGRVGRDALGKLMLELLAEAGVDCRAVRVSGDYTPVYVKRMRGATEEHRIDLVSASIATEGVAELVDDIRAAAAWADVLLVNQQLPQPWHIDVVSEINAIAAAGVATVVVDSRHAAATFAGVVLKMNDDEARTLCASLGIHQDSVRDQARELSRSTGHAVFVTRGPRGIAAASGDQLVDVPGIEVRGQLDTVGAGDTVLAALGGALACGVPLEEAAVFANVAASVVVTQLGTTGRAHAPSVAAAAATVDYSYEPELASNRRLARFAGGGSVEVVRVIAHNRVIRHAVFDHDGTLSCLREGWEQVMEPMMEDAVLGDSAATASEELVGLVRAALRQMIDGTTGAPTIVQMHELTKLVRQFAFVPEHLVRTAEQYKADYNERLTEMVDARVQRIADGSLEPADFQVKGAAHFLRLLRERGVTLHLASGTDEAAVRTDAEALGYSDMFDGGIAGASNDLRYDAKKHVMDEILTTLSPGETFVVFGDGPVEMREARRRRATVVGVCSDERRRHEFNWDKRPRLIKAGAELLIADFSHPRELLATLGLD